MEEEDGEDLEIEVEGEGVVGAEGRGGGEEM